MGRDPFDQRQIAELNIKKGRKKGRLTNFILISITICLIHLGSCPTSMTLFTYEKT